MSSIRQCSALLSINLRSIRERLGLILTIIIGMTCAIGVLVSMLAMGAGARHQAMSGVRPDRAILMSTGAESAIQSNIPKDTAYAIRDTPGIRRGANDEPIVVFEVLATLEARKRKNGTRINIPLFGASRSLTTLRPELRLTGGRFFESGLYEIIASEACVRQYTDFDIGSRRSLRGREWTIVGHFSQGSAGGACTLYADANSVISAFGRSSYNQVTVMLQSPAGFDSFRTALNANPALRVEAKLESKAAADASKQFTRVLNFASYFVGAIMALGATLGAVNSLYALVDSRRRELATLQAIGFAAGPVVASIVFESVLLALPGALIGAGLAWIFFNGMSVSPLGLGFQLAVTFPLVIFGIVWALIMGLLSGLLPALRAARMPITVGLRAT